MNEEGKKNPDAWRFSQCYGVAHEMYPRRHPAGSALKAVRALERGDKGNPAGGRTRRRTRRSRTRRTSTT